MRYLLIVACLLVHPASAQTAGVAYDAARTVLDGAPDDPGHGTAVIRQGVRHARDVLDSSGISLDPLEMQTFLSEQAQAAEFLADVETGFAGWFRAAVEHAPPESLAGVELADLLALSDTDLTARVLALPEP